ncbi:MAG: SMC-Scp complex subunit ScpB [gamma proteobacterium symbiont of Bathyaustriella thionipta]|nr:SMC-Scp complex subunit ScpB [gamma proteobacterium symbiont of Bathyaustriella thionipta]
MQQLEQILEAALMAAAKPLSLDQLQAMFDEFEQPDRQQLRDALQTLEQALHNRAVELVQISSGYRIQVRTEFAPRVARLWEEKPAKYSRALLETLALIAYRQPVTRGDIEDIRGVSVSSHIIKTLLEREWIRVVGQRDVPGRPSLYGTTRAFLDYFNLKSLDELPTLAEIRDLDAINRELDFSEPCSDSTEPNSDKITQDASQASPLETDAAGNEPQNEETQIKDTQTEDTQNPDTQNQHSPAGSH